MPESLALDYPLPSGKSQRLEAAEAPPRRPPEGLAPRHLVRVIARHRSALMAEPFGRSGNADGGPPTGAQPRAWGECVPDVAGQAGLSKQALKRVAEGRDHAA